ncbi:hypothetical protein P9112_003719 [Eukaryota sp. TZLM1-RC]
MRFRCFLWPNNLPNHLTCKCGKPLLFTHLLNCKHFITFRSKVHNNVRDQIYVMCKSHRVDSFFEPLLSKLIFDDPNIDSTRYNRAYMGLTRGDLVVAGLNGSFTFLDAMSIDPCNSSNEHLINSDVNNPLLAGEKYKIAKYAKPISSVNENSHAQYNLCPFVFSLLGSLGKAAMAFLEDFVVVVKERTGRIFNRVYWQNRIVFSIFKGMVKLISDSLSSFGKFSEYLAINCFDVGEAGFEDVEFCELHICPTPLCSLPPDHSEHIADSAPLDSFNLEKSHNCPICPSFFSKARTLCCHIDTHHSCIDTDTLHINNLVRCPVCLKVFSSVGFDNHFKRHDSPTLDMPCISDSLFIQLSNEIASFTYQRLSDRSSFRSAVKLVTHSSLPMEQKCRYLLVLPVVCLKLDKGSSLFKLFRFQHRVDKFNIGQCEDTSSFFCNTTPIRPHTFSNRVNIKRVKELIHDNELSRAMNLLSREPPTANITNKSMLEQLQHLHPADPNFCHYNNMLTEHYSYHDSSSVADAILNSPMTEGGPSHWHAKLLKQCIDDHLVSCVQYMANGLLSGKISEPLRRVLTSSRLLAIPKKSNGVRPLAVGELFYRIAAGLALSKVNVDYLINSNQYGVKVPGGGEAIVHSIRSNLGLSFEKLIKFDVRNAFNEVDRCQLAQAVAEYCPLLFPFFKASYLSPSTLHFRNSVIFSERGVRQGDPLGPLLFSTALVPFATQLSTLHPSCHFYLYLDDLFVLCNDHETHAIVGTVSSFIQDIGVEVNLDKTAVVSSNDNFEVLGAHFGPNAEDDLSSSLPPITSSLLKCLESLTVQEQLLLVRHCINTKLSFHARVHRPAVSKNFLISCFHQIVSFVSSALGVVPMFPQLISLPSARFGGLGLTNYGEIAHLCFAASYITSNRTLNLFHSLLPLDDLDLMCAESLVHELGTATNSPNLSKLQALLTQNHFLETLNSLTRDFRSKPAVLASFRSPVTDPAIAPIPIKYENDVLINCKPLSQSLLIINPSEELVDDSLLKYFLRTRLLCSEFVHHCPFCNHESNSQYHSANCEQLSSMRIRRHDDVVELISQLTGLLKEQNVGNGRVDLIRPDGSECYDLTLVGGYSTPLNTLIERRRMSKIGKYSHHVPLVPLIAFPFGGIERSFVNFLRKKEIGSYGKKISLSFIRSCFKMSRVYARLANCDLSDD